MGLPGSQSTKPKHGACRAVRRPAVLDNINGEADVAQTFADRLASATRSSATNTRTGTFYDWLDDIRLTITVPLVSWDPQDCTSIGHP
jgi:hypothetical protein